MRILNSAVLLLALAAPASAAPAAFTPAKAPFLVAQNEELCEVMRQNARTCYENWKSIGGGSSGQAGSFKECLKAYCDGLVGAGCSEPSYCQ